MPAQIAAIVIFVAVFAIGTMRNVHLGVLMLPAAFGVGIWIGGMPLSGILAGFPISIMVLLTGVTYFFAIAQTNGTLDAAIEAALTRVGSRAALLPLVFFALTAAVSAMGSPLASLVMAPVGMPIARRYGLDPMLMALAIGCGFSAGGFAPTSLFGIVSYGTAQQAGIDLSPFVLFAVAGVVNLVLLAAATLIFRRSSVPMGSTSSAREHESAANRDAATMPRARFGRTQTATVVCMAGLIIAVVGAALWGLEPDVGVLCFAFGAVLTLIDPAGGRAAVTKIDWSTVLLVGGIITFVGVLQKMGAIDLLGDGVRQVGTPMAAAFFVCAIAGLVSAFVSTTGILAALVPLGVPLVASGEVAGWALISSLAVCASIVDVSPFSTVGATLIATAAEDDRPRLTSLLTRWGLSMVVIGPTVLVGTLVLFTRAR